MTVGRSDQESLIKLLSDRFMSVDLGVEDSVGLAIAMAMAAQETFIVNRVEVAWFMHRSGSGWAFSSGARILGFEVEPQPLEQHHLSPELLGQQPLAPISGKAGLERSAKVAGDHGVAFRLRWPEGDRHIVELRILINEPLSAHPDEPPPTAPPTLEECAGTTNSTKHASRTTSSNTTPHSMHLLDWA